MTPAYEVGPAKGEEVMPPWTAALLTGVVFTGIGVAVLRRKVELPPPPSAADLVPQRTVANIKADTQAIEEASHGTATHS
ncbi:MAG TPA: phage holin family protein [Polyangiales bacterium]|nr:phage holin family protein [Polyangiales bacterium]